MIPGGTSRNKSVGTRHSHDLTATNKIGILPGPPPRFARLEIDLPPSRKWLSNRVGIANAQSVIEVGNGAVRCELRDLRSPRASPEAEISFSRSHVPRGNVSSDAPRPRGKLSLAAVRRKTVPTREPGNEDHMNTRCRQSDVTKIETHSNKSLRNHV